MPTTAHRNLSYPLDNLPEPDAPVSLVDLRDEALPRLQRAHCDLRGLSHATAARDWRIMADLGPTLATLADDVAECRALIDRTTRDELRNKALPKLRSAHCLLGALSLAVTRDQVLVEELPHALDDLADKIEVCRDLIDRTTRDV